MPVNQSFGAGMGPILLDNVTCDRNHLPMVLLQCVHPADIGIHNCGRENVAGVICPNMTIAIFTTIDIPSTTLISTNTQIIDSEVDTTAISSMYVSEAIKRLQCYNLGFLKVTVVQNT